MKQIAQRYMKFARNEAAGSSPCYEKLALHVAASPVALAFLDRLPPARQQPNLFFAALRLVTGMPASGDQLDEVLDAQADSVAQVMLTRTTQTNEPGRCATLLPVIQSLDGPVALIEIGCSAGLCLLMDRYGYDWGRQRIAPVSNDAPVFPCTVSGNAPLSSRMPDIVWRAGLDLNPLDIQNDDNVAWLEALVWPEHEARLQRLREAINLARADPPQLAKGDLRTDLHDLIKMAPSDANLVIFHSAVLTYLPDLADREIFAQTMRNSDATWLSNEGAHVLPSVARNLTKLRDDRFLLCKDGQPLAWAAPHGGALDWLVE